MSIDKRDDQSGKNNNQPQDKNPNNRPTQPGQAGGDKMPGKDRNIQDDNDLNRSRR